MRATLTKRLQDIRGLGTLMGGTEVEIATHPCGSAIVVLDDGRRSEPHSVDELGMWFVFRTRESLGY